MPSSVRQWALRELERAANNIDWCGAHMNEVVKMYQPTHPEIADPLLKLMELLVAVQEGVMSVRKAI